MKRTIFGLALFVAACAGLGARSALTPVPIIAAERAFAARAGEVGWIGAFKEYTAPDGLLLGQAGLVSAPERLAALADDGNRSLYWAPTYAGIARSGDFGFTTGPASFDAERTPAIQYFTVWRRQPDGSWRWIYDGGPGPVSAPGPYLAEGAEPAILPTASAGEGTAARAVARITEIELGSSTPISLAPYLAADAHVYRAGQPRAFGSPESEARMITPTTEIQYRNVRAEGSGAGDMVFTAGEADLRLDGQSRRGFYARIWQYRPEGWRIVYDQLVVQRAPQQG